MGHSNISSKIGTDSEILDGVLDLFEQICSIPHRSGNEKALSEHLAARCAQQGWQTQTDSLHNLRVDIPAAPGLEHLPPVIIQGHLDMVCAVTEGSGYEPDRDPVTMVVEGDILRSDGRSSLGADNGLAIAVALYLMQKGLRRGPVRLILTTQEEIGMHGAAHVDPSWVADCRWFINADTASSDALLYACASGRRSAFSYPMEYSSLRCETAFEIALTGFQGGHSGGTEALRRGNALKLMAFFLQRLKDTTDYDLADLRGGLAQNAIPSEAKAIIVPADAQAFVRAAEIFRAELAAHYSLTDPDIQLTVTPAALPSQGWTAQLRDRTLNLISLLYHGIYAMSDREPDLPAASCNVGLLHRADDRLELVTFARCAADFAEEQIGIQHRIAATLCGFDLHVHSHGAWTGSPDSPLVQLVTRIYKEQTGNDMVVLATHAGLEPGNFSTKNRQLDLVSIGPTIHDLHSTTERVELPTVPPFARLVAGVLEALAEA